VNEGLWWRVHFGEVVQNPVVIKKVASDFEHTFPRLFYSELYLQEQPTE